MTDIGTQIRDFAQAFADDLSPVEAGLVMERVSQAQPDLVTYSKPAQRRAPGWAVAIGTAALVLIVGVATTLLLSDLGSDSVEPVGPSPAPPVATTDQPSTTEPSTGVATETVDWAELDWTMSRLPTPSDGTPAWVHNLHRGRNMALHQMPDGRLILDGDYVEVLWTSEDGLTWNLVTRGDDEWANLYEYIDHLPLQIWPEDLALPSDYDGCAGDWHKNRLLVSDSQTVAYCLEANSATAGGTWNDMDVDPVGFWQLEDDGSWKRLPAQPHLMSSGYGWGTFGPVLDVGRQFIAVGDASGYWVSDDGYNWDKIEDSQDQFPTGTMIMGIAVLDDHIIMAGNILESPNVMGGTAYVWTAQLPLNLTRP